MKKSFSIFALLFILSGTVSAAATPGELNSEKTKNYSKTYALNSSDKVLLDNSFGEMKISTWSKNEIKVDVTISAKADNDEKAQKIIDRISIEDGKNGSEVFFKTHLKNEGRDDSHHEDRNNNENTSMKINYMVYMPASATLEATNQFGPMNISDYDGLLTINSKFGSLTAGKLTQVKKVSVEFGSATIESMNNGKLSVQFSTALINKLSGEINADFNQAHGVKISLDNNLTKLELNNNFSTVSLDADKNLSANFSIKTNFGNFSNKSVFTFNNDDDGDRYAHMKKNYSGKAGSGTIPINIKSNFGNITLGHDLPFVLKEKKGAKS